MVLRASRRLICSQCYADACSSSASRAHGRCLCQCRTVNWALSLLPLKGSFCDLAWGPLAKRIIASEPDRFCTLGGPKGGQAGGEKKAVWGHYCISA